MKYTKRLVLNRFRPTDNTFAVQQDGTIVTNTKKALETPSGLTSQRPAAPVNGEIRYNQTISDLEAYNISGQGTGWERIKTNRQTPVTAQNLGVGNYQNTLFGPLSYNVSTTAPQNVLVFVDNVYQIPNTNYTLVSGAGATTSTTLTSTASTGSNTLVVATTTNILLGMIVTASGGLANGTTVTNITTATRTITISPNTIASIPASSTVTFSEGAGTFVNFTSAVPAKPVFVLLGLDGYSPPNS
jgi:hypothetical protein